MFANKAASKPALAPKLTVQNAVGDEDTTISLAISASVSDPNEILSILISGVPDGATLSAGERVGDGSYLLSPTQLVGLTLTPPIEFEGTLHLQVTAVAMQASGGASAIAHQKLEVFVNPVAEAPQLN
jgi:hypothetical protein